MTDSGPLEGGKKIYVIIAVVMGALVVLGTVTEAGGAAYALATGQALGSGMVDRMARLDPRMPKEQARMMREMVDRQTAQQVRMAPLQLGLTLPYGAAAGVVAILALVWLVRGFGQPRWMIRAALVACVLRLAYGYVQYEISLGAIAGMQGMMDQVMEDEKARSGHQGRPEDVEQAKAVMGGFMALGHSLMGAAVAGQTAMMMAFWAGAWLVLRPREKTVAAVGV